MGVVNGDSDGGSGGDKTVQASPRQRRQAAQDRALWERQSQLHDAVVATSWVRGNRVVAFFVNFYASILVFAFHLLSLESLVSIALSVGVTICTSVPPCAAREADAPFPFGVQQTQF